MLASSTVENYLKAIYAGAATLAAGQRLLPMGQLATAVGVTPGTATTMVKTLAESGLVEYEPYAGVALTAAGQKLAALVLRRHRLIELFLVRVMGYSWDEVHDEAELLEHAVTDRLIDRMDEMLGRPETDPHGDPIPNAEGLVKPQEAQTLLSCPLETTVTVTRVIDQDKEFLRFIEQHHLKPGEAIEVEARDAAADSVRVRGKNDQRITIGTRAASKLLVHVAHVLLLCLLSMPALAQTDAQKAQPPRTNLSGYMDFHFNKPEFEDGRLDFHRFVLLVTHTFSPRIRFVGELELEHAFVEGLEEAGELELEQAYVDFLLDAILQRARRHDADADWHHQRAARAADLLRRRAAVHRHGDCADHLVRRRRRRARRDRTRLALPGLRHRAPQRRRVQRRGGRPRRPAKRVRVKRREARRHRPAWSTSAIAD